MNTIPPSWEVLDEEARARGMKVSYETHDGQGYVCYTNAAVDGMYLDHPVGRQGAQEMFEGLDSRQAK